MLLFLFRFISTYLFVCVTKVTGTSLINDLLDYLSV